MHKFNILPWDYTELSPERRAFLAGSLEVQYEDKKEALDKIN
ncbi:hypothetical protein [Metaclostridioides mangenotii]|uniref:Uncharacterized protein n=1 Tax=Metaclostridioides mangenotii TaxID=1540 RepID=A0ABS4E9N8_9FIRM|nr:hypothetical protein [Clostridioides mangenotii]MBP1854649.1 hypothetical protein [Clostridioides mangenotii]